jgi:hypothetical protein
LSAAARSASRSAREARRHGRPIITELPKKISANDSPITA